MSRTCQEEDWASGGLRSCGGQVFNIVELDILENVKHSRDHIVKSLFRDLNSNVDVLKEVDSIAQ